MSCNNSRGVEASTFFLMLMQNIVQKRTGSAGTKTLMSEKVYFVVTSMCDFLS